MTSSPGGKFGSIVLGRNAAAARRWNANGKQSSFEEMIIVGERIQSLPLNGLANAGAPTPNTIFDRALPLTDSGALSRLSRMRIGVIGDSGTGSLTIELLLRAGVGEIVIFEFDLAEGTNLNRVLHLRRADAEKKRPKVDRTAEVIQDSGLPTQVTIVPGGDIRNKSVADELRGCDALFGCVDRDWPRLIMCEVAYQYLVPFIDLGTEIGLNDAEVQSLDARVSYVAPGRPCLLCAGVVTSERVGLEGQTPEELDRVLSMGYSQDFRLRNPTVMELNMRAAAQAGLLLRHLLQPFLATPLPHSIRESLTNFSVRGVLHSAKTDCLLCGRDGRPGVGPRYRLTTRT